MKRTCLLSDARRIANEVERLHELVAGQHVLSAETIGIRALLDFVSCKRRRDDSRTRLHFDLMDGRADRRGKKLLDAAKGHGSFRHRDALHARHGTVSGQQMIQLALDGNLEWVFDE